MIIYDFYAMKKLIKPFKTAVYYVHVVLQF